MDVVISQYDRDYITALQRYGKALQQRNVLLRAEEEPDSSLLELLEMQMGDAGEAIYGPGRHSSTVSYPSSRRPISR